MKLTIQEIRTAYRNATDKEAAIKELADSEETSEQMIKFYVRGAALPVRPEEKPVQVITDAFVPVPAKRKGRPVKNLKPAREPATKRAEKPPKAKREVKKVAKPANDTPDPVIKEAETVNEPAKNDIKEPVSAFGWPKMTIAPREALPMILLGQEVKSSEDVTRIITENNALMNQCIQFTHFIPVTATQEEKEMFFADINDDRPSINGHEPLEVDTTPEPEPVPEEQPASDQQYCIAPRKPPIGLVPRFIWNQERISDIVMAIDRYTVARNPVPIEWVEEYNEMIAGR